MLYSLPYIRQRISPAFFVPGINRSEVINNFSSFLKGAVSVILIDRFRTDEDYSFDPRPLRCFEYVDRSGDVHVHRLVEGRIALFGADGGMNDAFYAKILDGPGDVLEADYF